MNPPIWHSDIFSYYFNGATVRIIAVMFDISLRDKGDLQDPHGLFQREEAAARQRVKRTVVRKTLNAARREKPLSAFSMS
jgi:hypothetical protein